MTDFEGKILAENIFSLKTGVSTKICDVSDNPEKQLHYLINTKRISIIEIDILRALYTFRYLNIYNLNRYLKTVLPDYITKTDFSYNVKRLYELGYLYKHTFYYKGDDEVYSDHAEQHVLVAYSLSKEAYHFVAVSNSCYKTYSFKNPEEETDNATLTSRILEHLSLAQWHISVISNDKAGYKVDYQAFMLKKSGRGIYATYPSFIKVNVSGMRDKKKDSKLGRSNDVITLIAMPVVRNLSSSVAIGHFFRRLLRIRGSIADNLKFVVNPLFVFLVDSEKTAADFMKLLKRYDDTKDIPFCFCMDCNTKTEYSLQMIEVGYLGTSGFVTELLDLTSGND